MPVESDSSWALFPFCSLQTALWSTEGFLGGDRVGFFYYYFFPYSL